ncbi:ubiquitin recognition factor in ER-associated degradation protein 1 isoform X1 [Eurytemora carolleeae]|uniref:ubiquitin recognition factor in ER-associated degradation protein 1 isoform X1 n=1 Tax=Eurytemora carolleeae TaxID=1294199 RepID=UPI000C76EB9F|nr:ubiquitin recognition factor in ER-associated degradation protein 1 isoform X1 [Eurytemora carolleeae]|eukprot:XP_023329176.1 ubiquitin recognition factor in ER-associated degradation protein 1-like isoform X1 [Eurytemora affinis]
MFGVNFGFPDIPRPFNTQYRCFSVSMLPGNERSDVEAGGKIIMPPSALDQLTRLNIVYPMLFKLTNKQKNRNTHCGVLEFVADEGKIYIPYWMMQNLMLEEGGLIQVESANLPVATYSKFQPLNKDFLDLTNPKAVLEMRLRHFACLSKGDIIAINYNKKIYELNVLETKPAPAVSIIECDMNVEFEAPPGYEEPTVSKPQPMEEEEDPELDISQMLPEPSGFMAFAGSGNRLDGKKKRTSSENEIQNQLLAEYTRGIPDYNYEAGSIKFIRARKRKEEKENIVDDFEAFQGQGKSLRQAKKK